MVKQFYLTHRWSQSIHGGNGNEGVFYIRQSSQTEALPSDGLISYPGHLFGEGSYPSAEMQSAYSTAPSYLVAIIFGNIY